MYYKYMTFFGGIKYDKRTLKITIKNKKMMLKLEVIVIVNNK